MPALHFYTVEKLGKKRSLTPEGFLLCEEVPIARTGLMTYGPDETPIDAGPDGFVKVMREEDEVFSELTLASYQGKSVTQDHPEEDVNPANWRSLTVGICMNPRRGKGLQDDLLLADLLITHSEAIELVQAGNPEVSCGYEADYEETGPGIGYQRNILGNHIALVENGRCGPRCAIGDHSTVVKPTKKENVIMAKKSWVQRALDAFKDKDEEALKEVLAEKEKTGDETISGGEPGEGGGGDTHIHIHQGGAASASTDEGEEGEILEKADNQGAEGKASTLDEETESRFAGLEAAHQEIISRLTAIETSLAGSAGANDGEDPDEMKALKDEAPEGEEEEAAKAKDSAYLVDSFRDTLSLAEILAPGIKAPTFDSAAKPGESVKKICNFRRSALDLAYVQPQTRGMIEDTLAGKDFDIRAMSCDAVRHLFKTVAGLKRQANNLSATSRTGDQMKSGNKGGEVRTLADVNRINAERWKTK